MLTARRVFAFLGAGIVIGFMSALITDRMGGGTDEPWAVARSMVWLVATFLWIGVAWLLFAPPKRR